MATRRKTTIEIPRCGGRIYGDSAGFDLRIEGYGDGSAWLIVTTLRRDGSPRDEDNPRACKRVLLSPEQTADLQDALSAVNPRWLQKKIQTSQQGH